MNKRLILSLAALSTLSMTALPAFAEYSSHHVYTNTQTRDPGINHRQEQQGDGIRQGVRSGELTRVEARNLREERQRIAAKERQYKSDGHLSRAERQDLQHDLDALSRDIKHEKHDNQERYRGGLSSR